MKILLLAILTLCLTCACYAQNIIKTGVYNNNGGKAAILASNELCKYLSQMTGKTYTTTNTKSQAGFILNINQKIKPDGFQISYSNGQLIIEGGNSRGCLYGAYEALENFGITWTLPTKRYENIPKVSNLKWKSGTIKSQPALDRRGYTLANVDDTEYILDFIEYMAKQKCNYLFMHNISLSSGRMEKVKAALNDREMYFAYGGHGLPGMLPRNLFESHPEYFRMANGVRKNDYNFCPSSDAALDIVAENVKNWMSIYTALADSVVFQIWADDLAGNGWCECDKCKKYSESEQYLMSLNGIAKRLKTSKDKISFLSYHTTLPAPINVTADNNFVPLMYAPRERCYNHTIDGCQINKEYENYFINNAKVFPKNADIFEYYFDCVLFRQMSVPLQNIIGKDVTKYIANGASGMVPLHFGRFSDLAYGINTYVTAKAMWRGGEDKKDTDNFCKEMYGNAWKEMRTYYNELETLAGTAYEACEYEAIENPDLRYPMVPPYTNAYKSFNKKRSEDIIKAITAERIKKTEEAINKAYQETNDIQRERVIEQKAMWAYTKDEIDVIKSTVYVSAQLEDALKSNNNNLKDNLIDICNTASQKAIDNAATLKTSIQAFGCQKAEGDVEKPAMASGIQNMAEKLKESKK